MKMNNKIKSIKYNFIMNAILAMASVIFPLITFPYITRVLLPEGTGKIAFANSIVSYFSMFAMLGIPTYGIRACAQVRDDKEELSKTVHEIWIINTIMTAVAFTLFYIAIKTIPALKDEYPLMLICGCTIIFNLIGMEWLYKGMESYSFITIRSLLFKVIGIVLMYLMVHKQSDYLVYAAIAVLSNCGYGILNFIYAHKYITFNRRLRYNLKRHLKPIVIFFTMSVAVAVYTNLDIVMLGFLKNTEEVGYYDVAVKVKVILVNLVTALGAVVLPRTSYYVEKKRKEDFYIIIKKTTELVAVISIPLAAFFIIMAKESILFLAGEEYLPAVMPMIIIMPSLVMIGFSNLLGMQILVPFGKEKVVMYSEIIGAAVDAALNLVFIPKFGASGAAFGTLIAEISVLLIQYLYLKAKTPSILGMLEIKKILISLLTSMVMLYAVKFCQMNLFLTLTLTSIMFFLTYISILVILKESSMMMVISSIKEKIPKRFIANH